ncbi:MAG: hypothetical protein SPL64_04330 [Bacteroidaceae bacterium]|nr:hypothetical protein [Bacteroidaceae bacterium]
MAQIMNTHQQIRDALRRLCKELQQQEKEAYLTDIFLLISPAEGLLIMRNDEGKEIMRSAVDAWKTEVDSTEMIPLDEEAIVAEITSSLNEMLPELRALPIIKPFSFVWQNGDELRDLLLIDDDLMFVDEDLMKGLNEDLDKFWDDLAKKF